MVSSFARHTVLVTGASSGIGTAIARALAARGADLVLVARRRDRLEEVADQLRSTHRVRVHVIAADLSRPRPSRAVREDLLRHDIRITGLVNNAGFATDGPFRSEDPDRLASEIALDVGAVVDLSREFVDDLRDADGGLLVNVTSEAAYHPIPGMAVYSAAKAFVLAFTTSLWWELGEQGVRTLAFAPGLTATEFFDEIGREQYPASMQTPERVAESLMRVLERADRGPTARARRGGELLGRVGALLSSRARVGVVARAAGSRRLLAAR